MFIDTGFFIAYKNTRDIYHNHAQHLVAQMINGMIIKPYTCDYVFDEAMNVPRLRKDIITDPAKRFKLSCDVGKAILNDKYWEMRIVDKGNVKDCYDNYIQHPEIDASFTDWIVGQMAVATGQKTIITSDRKDLGKISKIYSLDKPLNLMKNEEFDILKDKVGLTP